jgi:prepilin-type N-terminal cleavage/methylation domain-containing protein
MKKGFSFLELLAVIGLIAILLYITLTSFRSKTDLKLSLENFTTQLKEDLRYVRMRAIITKTDMELHFNPSYTSYTFLDDKGLIILRENTENITIDSTGTIFSFDSDGDLTIDNTYTSGEINLSLDIYSATLRINNKGFIEVKGP